ncbi:ChbG/HpnK family deacetylase [Patescibacteria group bacterium]|nr:ChbG/HpnK family deacetylase [Patescibacteria group bacterium]
MKEILKTSYIFPVYNEEKDLATQIESFIAEIKQHNLPLDEIILIENGSADKSWNEICRLENKYKFIKKRRISFPSFGQAVKHGLLSSNCRYLFVLNVDFYDIDFIKKSFKKLQTHNIVSGSKLHKQSSDSRPYFERLRTKLLGFVLKYILKYEGTDTHGIKAFRNTKKLKKALREITTKHELFDTELLLKLKNEVIELPITIREIRPSRYSSLQRIVKTCIDLIRLIDFRLLKSKSSDKIVADDYGMSEIINNAIIDQLQAKSITHISVFANMVSKKDLNILKKLTDDYQIIVHINLLRGKPILETQSIPTLVDNNGIFYNLPNFLLRLIIKKISKSEIKKEIEAQIIFFQKKGIIIKEINSEQHLHIFEPVRSILNEISEEKRIKKVRTLRSIKNYLKPRFHKYLVYYIFSTMLILIYKQTKTTKNIDLDLIVHPGSNYD